MGAHVTAPRLRVPWAQTTAKRECMGVMSFGVPVSAEQRAICESQSPRMVIEANAGAGKTTTAAMKIASWVAQGANPAKILALSYTAPGVQAFHEAFRRLALAPEVLQPVRVGTFDAFCAARLARLEGTKVKQLTLPEQVRPHVLAAISEARAWVLDTYGDIFTLEGSGEFAIEGLLDEFAHIKGTLELQRAPEGFKVSPQWAAEVGRDFTTLAIFRAYEHRRRHAVGPDGEGTLFRYTGDATYDLACVLMDDDPIFTYETHPLRLGLDAVILDEMHDTNWAMFTVLKSLLEANDKAVFLGVGDRDQVIHARNGADAYFMGEGFDRHIGAPQHLPLTATYRFGETLAQPLGSLAEKTYHAENNRVSQVRVRPAASASDVFAVINEALSGRSGAPAAPADIAVLLRYPGAAADLEHELRRLAMPYEAVGFTTYLERPEVLFVRMILGAAVRLQDTFRPDVALLAKRATWAFVGGTVPMGEDGIDRTEALVESSAHEHFAKSLLPVLLARSPFADARVQVTEAMRHAASDRIEDLPRAVAALGMAGLARRVFVKADDVGNAQASVMGLVRACRGYASISQFLRSLMSHDHDSRARSRAAGRITLSSIEAAKGLEYEHVIVADANRAAFNERLDDDRNLFYVAASRARSRLTLLYRSGEASPLLRWYGDAQRP